MLFGETVAVYCENHTEHINTLCGQNVEILALKRELRIVPIVLYKVTILMKHFRYGELSRRIVTVGSESNVPERAWN
jgi:hypothetical protein